MTSPRSPSSAGCRLDRGPPRAVCPQDGEPAGGVRGRRAWLSALRLPPFDIPRRLGSPLSCVTCIVYPVATALALRHFEALGVPAARRWCLLVRTACLYSARAGLAASGLDVEYYGPGTPWSGSKTPGGHKDATQRGGGTHTLGRPVPHAKKQTTTADAGAGSDAAFRALCDPAWSRL